MKTLYITSNCAIPKLRKTASTSTSTRQRLPIPPRCAGAGAGVYTKHIIKNTVLYSAVYGVYTRAEETCINIIRIN